MSKQHGGLGKRNVTRSAKVKLKLKQYILASEKVSRRTKCYNRRVMVSLRGESVLLAWDESLGPVS